MEKNLVLQDKNGNVLRVFAWDGEETKVIRRADTRRLELVKSTEHLESKKIAFQELGTIESESILKNPYLVGELGSLQFSDSVEQFEKDPAQEEENRKTYFKSLIALLLLVGVGMGALQFVPQITPSMEEELKETVAKLAQSTPPKPVVVKLVPSQPKPDQPVKTQPTKVSVAKRAGALSALGSLSAGKNRGGLDIGAAQSTGGPGLGGTQGSGGVQTSIYAKGVVGSALGAGNNVSGAGGYGTKGKGGGQAGYGKLALTGSTGASPIPLGSEANVASGLDKDQIAAVVNRNMGQVRFCYEEGLRDDASLNGRVAVNFVIGGNGMVKTAQVATSTLKAKAVEDCIVMRVKSWKFPVPDGGVDVEVTFPFSLRRSGQG